MENKATIFTSILASIAASGTASAMDFKHTLGGFEHHGVTEITTNGQINLSMDAIGSLSQSLEKDGLGLQIEEIDHNGLVTGTIVNKDIFQSESLEEFSEEFTIEVESDELLAVAGRPGRCKPVINV